MHTNRALRPLLDDSRDKAAIVLDYIEKRAGLLIGQGERDRERQFSFPQRTFQERIDNSDSGRSGIGLRAVLGRLSGTRD